MRSIVLILLLVFLCPFLITAQENTAILCADGIDNDGDGFADCDDTDCLTLSPIGCSRCNQDGTSFGDVILCADIQCVCGDPDTCNQFNDPNQALGMADNMGDLNEGNAVSLGAGGSICIGFVDNLLANSGTPAEDLWVFEVGLLTEPSSIEIRPADAATITALNTAGILDSDGDGYYEFGNIQGATAGLDIDAFLPNTVGGTLLFDAVKITDQTGDNCDNISPGPDIDGICALFSLPPDCAGTPGGDNILDDCGVCLSPDDPNFNQSCLDCAGIPNGFNEVDQCGDCLNPFDPNWNQSCADCAGIPNGDSMVDGCTIEGMDTTCGEDNGTANVTVQGGVLPYTFNWSNGFNGQNISFLPAGDFTVTVIDDVGCSTECSVTIGASTNPDCTTTPTNTTCGLDNGTVTADVLGGSAPYSYIWNNGTTDQIAIDLAPGDYTVTVSDTNGCTSTCVGTVVVSTNVSCSINANNTSCGLSNGTATINTADGESPYTYLWNNGETTDNISDLAPGDYSVTVTDANGCTTECSSQVADSSNPTCSTMSTNTSLGQDNGSATVTAADGIEPYSYNWSNGSTSATADNLAFGDYTVTITDASGCTAECAATIGDSSNISCSINETNTTCGEDNGEATASVNGGDTPINYEWSNGESSPSISDLAPGDYDLTVTDAGGFSSECSITIDPSSMPTLSVESFPTTCGNDNGTAIATGSDGVEPYTYIWSNGDGGINIDNLGAGDYTVTVEDALGCTNTGITTIVDSSNPSCEVGSTDTTLGENNGAAIVNVLGGLSPFTYEWNTGETTESITNLAAGDYTVTVTDADGCDTECSATILASSVPTCNVQGTDTTCGEDNGTASVSIGGGEAPYSIEWNTGDTSEDINNLPAGDYTVTITDADGVTVDCSIEIGASTNPSCSVIGVNTTSAQQNGSASVDVQDGEAPFDFEWSNGDNGQNIEDLAAGDYTVTVTDADGCITECSTTIAESSVPSCSIQGEATTCEEDNGNASVSTGGGTEPYTYEWSNGETSETIENLAAGDYSVTVTDSNGELTDCSVTIESSENPSCQATSSEATDGQDNGSASVSANGGIGPYSFEWNTGAIDETINDLPPGDYSVTVTDSNGCTSICEATVGSSNTPSCSIEGQNTTCGDDNGSALVTPQGGVAPYSFEWSNGENTDAIVNLAAGDYSVTISDADEVTIDCSITIESSSNPSCTTTSTSASPDQDNGSATAQVMDGEEPYTYEWSNGTTDQTAIDLAAGDYTVIVTDANQCITSCSATITSSSSPSCSIQGTNTTCGEDNGSATITVGGGTGPYDIEWNNGESSETVSNLASGDYTVVVTDAEGVSSDCSVTIEPSSNPGCIANSTNASAGQEDGTATVTASGGNEPYTYAWSNNETDQTIIDLEAGEYTVTVTDVNGCVTTCSTIVNQDADDSPSCSVSGQDTMCGEENGNATVVATSGVPPYTYSWSNGETTENISNLADGEYTVTVTDSNGNTTSCSIEIFESDDISCTISTTDITCLEESGSATVSATGGVPPYTYAWSQNGTEETQEDLEVGDYSVTVTDLDGCTTECSTTISMDSSVEDDCMDCAGIMNGNSIIDECGTCLEPDNPEFNQACADCAGNPNGNSIIDECGECMSPDDPLFNRSCEKEISIYIPNVITPDSYDFNREFIVSAEEGKVIEILDYKIYDRWGSLVYKASNFDIESNQYWWNGTVNGEKPSSSVYAYAVEVEFFNGEVKLYCGNVTLIR